MSETLRDRLAYEPVELQFGTSGRRGRVVDLTQLEVFITARAELDFLLSLPCDEGGIGPGDEVYVAADLRPSSVRLAPEQGGRGELVQAVCAAASDAGLVPVYEGVIPTPALAHWAFAHHRASIMVTGSHIPFERNGYKLNTSIGELLKRHEPPIQAHVARVRAATYTQSFADSPFNQQGMFRSGSRKLPPALDDARRAYVHRYADIFPGRPLAGKRILVYQHSAAGRDILVEILEALGAAAIPAGRSQDFIPIDTENVDAPLIGQLQHLADEAVSRQGELFAVISTDGDSDRPLFLSVDRGRLHFHPGDLLGMAAAQFLGADAVVVPISCNDAIDRGPLSAALEPKTRIGSPYVIAGMQAALARGRRRVCGWEANGGFLTASDIEIDGRVLTALPTRDALLPMLAVLAAAAGAGVGPGELFRRLPRRFSRSALMRDFPRSRALRILEHLTPQASDGSGLPFITTPLASFFTPEQGFGAIERLDATDGLRIHFTNGDIAHLRPSGNADEFRIYAVADSEERAASIAAMGVAEPAGILRRMERAFCE